MAAIVVALVGGCAPKPGEGAAGEPPISAMQPTEPEPFVPAEPEAAPQPEAASPATVGEKTVVTIRTAKGDMVAELYDEQMPITAGNFLLLVEDGFYDGLTFHRVEPGFVIQGGDPKGDGTGGPGFTIPLETDPDIIHDRGVLSMARTSDPDSAGCQFFVCLARETCKSLDGEYAAFGRVIEGVEVADQIAIGDKISKITVDSVSPHAEAAREAARKARVTD
ncbi:MAG: peptidylprolyl isomerase [Armatimonadota bacterium]